MKKPQLATNANDVVFTTMKNAQVVVIHALIWMGLFSLPLLFRPDAGPGTFPGPAGDFPFRIPVPIWVNDLYLLLAFYVNLLVLMPRFFSKSKWGYYLIFTLLFVAGSFFLHQITQWIDQALMQNGFGGPDHFRPGMDVPDKPGAGGHAFPGGPDGFPPGSKPEGRFDRNHGFGFHRFSFMATFAMAWALSTAYYLFGKLQESVRHADRVKASALQSELSFLKAQINPHFLFNTLNNIYVLTLKKSDVAPEAVMKLSNLMRKLTSDTSTDFVPCAEEVQFIRDYIELQQLRLTDKTKVIFEVEGQHNRTQIAPRIFVPFIDNAFKYGVSNRLDSEIFIRMHFSGPWLHFTIRNAVHPGNGELFDSAGVGIGNSKRRLELLYKDNYELIINENPQSYEVLLTLNLE